MNFRQYNLKLRPNNFLAASKLKTVVKMDGDRREEIAPRNPTAECHYLHVGGDLVAALSHCSDNDVVS